MEKILLVINEIYSKATFSEVFLKEWEKPLLSMFTEGFGPEKKVYIRFLWIANSPFGQYPANLTFHSVNYAFISI